MNKEAKRPADPVGERRAGNKGMAVLSKIKKPCLNAVARESERARAGSERMPVWPTAKKACVNAVARPRLQFMLAVVAFIFVGNK